MKEAFNDKVDYQEFKLTTFNDSQFFVRSYEVRGDPGFIREYRTFINDEMVDIWVYEMTQNYDSEADLLFSYIKLAKE